MEPISTLRYGYYRIVQPAGFDRESTRIAGEDQSVKEPQSEGNERSSEKVKNNSGIPGTDNKLSEEELRQVEKLRQRDQEVRAHEQAHIAAGGQYVRGGANFEYQRGPDGKLYAVGGEVSIDVSPIPNNPSATIRKMETVVRAALAPSQPSAQDYQVAARAQMEISKAQMELLRKKGKEFYSNSGKLPSGLTDQPQNSIYSIVA